MKPCPAGGPLCRRLGVLFTLAILSVYEPGSAETSVDADSTPTDIEITESRLRELAQTRTEVTGERLASKAPAKETVPGEITERGEDDAYGKQEHALKSLPPKGGYTVIPLPAFAYARNESYWAGALAPILRANEKEELEDIFAPQYLHNKFVGETLSLNYYGYRNETIQYRAIAAYATEVERHFELGYKNTGAVGGRYILSAEANWFKNAFTRFFGIGNRTPEQNESTYTDREANARISAGINLVPNFSILWTERYRNVRVDDGIIPTLPQTRVLFPSIQGIDGSQIFGHRLTFLYDSRDNILTPKKGVYASLYWELAHDLIHREPDRWVRFAFDARYLLPHASDRAVLVTRLMLDKLFSHGIPFYERPTLGGENTLRGFGLNRFTNDSLYLINFEERIRIYERRIFDNPIEVEAAPFLDMGRVNRELLSHLYDTQFNPGIGVRVISRPNVVGRLDVGYGKDGANTFVGLDYPF